MTRNVPQQTPEFVLDPVLFRGLMRLVLLAAILGEVANLALYAARKDSVDMVLLLSALLALAAAAVLSRVLRRRQGTVLITADRLEVRTRGQVFLYPWQDIAELRVKTVAESDASFRVWAKLLGLRKDQELIEMRLKRSVRLSVLKGESGPAVRGVPTIVNRMARLFVSDPESLAQLANSLMRAS